MTTNSDENDTQTLTEREKYIKEDLLLKIPMMHAYLGNVDFNTEFYAQKRHGLGNWDFEDRGTKTTFQAYLIGEIADATQGTNLKGKGNFKPPKSDPTLRLNDKTNVKNIIVLRTPAGSNVKAEKAFLNQTVPLNNIFEHIGRDDERTNLKPSNGNRNSWLDTTAASDADNRPSDLIVVNLLKKFDSPKVPTNYQNTNRVTERVPLTDDDDGNTTDIAKGKKKASNESQDQNVVIGGFYEPSLLPDYSTVEFGLIKNKLVQHDVTDIDDRLIPAWKLEKGLRPGSIILVCATLHVYNIENKGMTPGFRRYYQINAERIKVLAKPVHHELSSLQHYDKTKLPVFDDFAIFSSKKRKDNTTADDHSTKKNKSDNAYENDFEMVLGDK